MGAKEAPIRGKVRKKSSSGLSTVGRRRGVQGATTEINHFGELGSEASTFGQSDLQGSANAVRTPDLPRTDEEETASTEPPAVDS